MRSPIWLLGALVLVSVVVSVWGLAVLPPDARFRSRVGGLGPDVGVPRLVALIGWPFTAFLAAGGAAIITMGEESEGLLLGVFGLGVILFGQVSSIRNARRRSPDA
jgi:hypothetical protein